VAIASPSAIDRLGIVRATPADLVHDIDRITLGEEILAPAIAAVGRAHVACAREAAALDHHDRVGIGRDVVLGIGLASKHRAVFRIHIFTADEEVAGLDDRQEADAVRMRGRKRRCDAGQDENSRGEAADPFVEAGNRQEFARGGLHQLAPMSRVTDPTLKFRHVITVSEQRAPVW
jgi:hypothetical protein